MNTNINTEIKLINSTEFMASMFGTTPHIQKLLNENFKIIDQKKVIKKLLNDIKSFPHIPQLKQQLHTAYQVHKMKEADDYAALIYKEHPTYFFGKMNMALQKYYEDDFEGMLQYLGKDVNIKTICPDREEFHTDEMMNFLFVAALYRNATEPDRVQCNIILDIMNEIDSDHDTIKQLEREIIKFNIYNPHARKFNIYMEDIHPPTSFIQSIPKTTVAPVFENSLFDDLYCNGIEIDQAIIRDILKLPDDIIKTEFQKIIDDTIARFDFLTEENIKDLEIEIDEEDEEQYFYISDIIFHSMLILGETNNPDNLSLIFQIMRQGEQYCESFLGENITYELWKVLYKLSDGKEDELVDFLKEPNRFVFCKSEVIKCLQQLALKQPQKKAFVINAVKELLEFFLLHKEDENILDTLIVSYLLELLVDFDTEEHFPLVKKMFDENLVSISSSGTYNELIYKHNKNKKARTNLPIELDIISIYEVYDELNEAEQSYSTDDYDKFLDQNYKNNYSDGEGDDIELLPIRTEPKIGRNEPCPCGSEKKFKKCCIDKGIY